MVIAFTIAHYMNSKTMNNPKQVLIEVSDCLARVEDFSTLGVMKDSGNFRAQLESVFA